MEDMIVISSNLFRIQNNLNRHLIKTLLTYKKIFFFIMNNDAKMRWEILTK